MSLDTGVEPTRPLFEELKLIRHCPMCSETYGGSEVHMFESSEQSHFFHITCLKCQGSLLGIVVTSDMGMSSVYTVTDLTVLDIVEHSGNAGVSEEELLAFHEYLQQKNLFETAILIA